MLPGRQMEVRLYDPDRPLVPAAFGILEPPADAPFSLERTSALHWSPPCAMTAAASRLGFGGGYYDRWLSGFSGVTVGCAGTVCSKSTSRIEDHDRRVEFLLTESRRFSSETQRERVSLPPSAGPLRISLSIHSCCHSRSRRSCSRSRSCSHSRFRCRPSCFRSSSTG